MANNNVRGDCGDYKSGEDYSPEIALWKAVILQAFVDMKNKSKKKIANTYRTKAIFWFNRNDEEFVMVCNHAAMDPGYVWNRAREIKEEIYGDGEVKGK